ncbi:MAG: hypothetical protein ACKO4Z_02875 [Planctomycetota bacterium]
MSDTVPAVPAKTPLSGVPLFQVYWVEPSYQLLAAVQLPVPPVPVVPHVSVAAEADEPATNNATAATNPSDGQGERRLMSHLVFERKDKKEENFLTTYPPRIERLR